MQKSETLYTLKHIHLNFKISKQKYERFEKNQIIIFRCILQNISPNQNTLTLIFQQNPKIPYPHLLFRIRFKRKEKGLKIAPCFYTPSTLFHI